jgi:hypothetical protein
LTQALDAAAARIEVLEKLVSNLRHDLRNAISSSSLIADALVANRDPVVQRSGQRIAATTDRIIKILDATLEVVPRRSS